MKILVLSDIHDHVDNLRKVMGEVDQKVEAVVFCGDMCAPFTAGILGEIGLPIYACLGNNDEDHLAMSKKGGSAFNWVNLSREYSEIEFEERKIAFNHYPKLGELLAKSGEYDAVFYGHTHEIRNEMFENTLLVNSGAVCGIQGGKYGVASYALYDTEVNKAEIIRF